MDKFKPPEFYPSFYGPKYWLSWVLLALFRLLGLLPIRVNLWIGRFIGFLFYHLGRSRRLVAQRNLELCFPHLREVERAKLVRGVMQACGISITESAMALWGQKDKFKHHHSIAGVEHIASAQAAGRGVLLVGCHMTTLDVAARILAYYCRYSYLYRKDPNALLAYYLTESRVSYLDEAIITKNTRRMIHLLREGKVIWYAPDQDYGAKHSTFAPFFGVEAASLLATAKLARLGNAVVIPFAHYREPNGSYRIIIKPALDNYPSGDELDDALRINQLVEDIIREQPDQYLWVHKRFKTRPSGAASLYEKRE